MQRIKLDTSPAIIDIGPIGSQEIISVTYESSEPWPNDYEVKFWNSAKKNTEINAENALGYDDVNIVLTIDPDGYSMPTNGAYYEIIDTVETRIIFKGNIEIVE